MLTACLVIGCLSACTSTSEFESLSSQLLEVQTQLRQLQLDVSSKEEFSTLATSLERDNDALLRAQADTADLVRAVREELVRLTAVLAEQGSEIGQLRTQLSDLEDEMDDLRDLLAEQAEPAQPLSIDISDPAALYQASFDDFQRRNYTLALAGFRRFLELFPAHLQADSALYWIGECYLNQGEYREAIREFDQVASRFPQSTRLASALLRKADAHQQLGETERARTLLSQLIDSYPESDEALLAQQRLDDGA